MSSASHSPTTSLFGTVTPNGNVVARLGAIYTWSPAPATVEAWMKTSELVAGTPDNTGWTLLGPAYANMHFHDPGTPTTIVTPAVFVKAANVSHLHNARGFTMPVDNRLRYDGLTRAMAAVTASLSFNCAANNQILAFALAVDGVVSVSSIVRTKVTTGTDIQAVAVVGLFPLNPASYFEVWVANDSSTGSITIDHGNIVVQAFAT